MPKTPTLMFSWHVCSCCTLHTLAVENFMRLHVLAASCLCADYLHSSACVSAQLCHKFQATFLFRVLHSSPRSVQDHQMSSAGQVYATLCKVQMGVKQQTSQRGSICRQADAQQGRLRCDSLLLCAERDMEGSQEAVNELCLRKKRKI